MLFTISLLFVLGAAVGSFLSVVTWRLPAGEKFTGGRSHCPKCGSQIAWYDNIPIVSYLLLSGKCRNCGKSISLRYPALEIASGLSLAGLFSLLNACSNQTICVWKSSLGFWGSYLFLSFILFLIVAVFVIDMERRIIPDGLVFFGLGLTIIALMVGSAGNFYSSLFSAFSTAFLLLVLHLITKGKGMGLGDVKFALLGGLFFGWPTGLIWLFMAFLTGAGVAIILILVGLAKKKDKIAFGPFLALSFVITGLWGQQLINWILR